MSDSNSELRAAELTPESIAELERRLKQQQQDLERAKELARQRREEEQLAHELQLARSVNEIDAQIEAERQQRQQMQERLTEMRLQAEREAKEQAELDMACTFLYSDWRLWIKCFCEKL